MSGEPELARKDKGPDVRRLQQLLVDAGFDPGPVDGDFGSGTDGAVRAFQAAKGLHVDGIVGARTWEALQSSPAPHQDAPPPPPPPPPGAGRSVSEVGLRLIQMFEGLSLDPYNDPAGHCTVGYGHLLHHGNCDGAEAAVSSDGATALLRDDASVAGSAINHSVTVGLTQAQFDALTSFVFNVGTGAFAESTLLRQLNEGAYDAVPTQLNRWVHADGGILAGLVTRRDVEGRLFRDGVLTEIAIEGVFRLPKPIIPPDGP